MQGLLAEGDFELGETNAPGLPPDFTRKESVVAGVNAIPTGSDKVCSGGTNACYRTPFSTSAPAMLSVRLGWMRELNDFDVRLYRGGVLVASSADSGRGVSEAMDVALEADEYDLVVVAWIVTQDAFTLTGNFTVPPADDDARTCSDKPLIRVGPVSLGGSGCRRG